MNMDRFEEVYPSDMPGRLAFFEDDVRIGKRPLLQMMMLEGDDLSYYRHVKWSVIVDRFPMQAGKVEELLFHVLRVVYYFDYEAMAQDPQRMSLILGRMKADKWFNDIMWDWHWRWL